METYSDQTLSMQDMQDTEWNGPAGRDGCYFTVIAGADLGRIFLLEKAETVLGRSAKADIQVNDAKVSRQHLKISYIQNGMQAPRRVVVADLHSRNGLFLLNGVRVYEQELSDGDKVRVGDTILKFEVKDRLDVAYHDQLYQQAIRDALTGLWNRNYFQNELRQCISLSSRHHRTFAVLMLDIDFFKKVNDTYGHNVGDHVLKTIATMLTHNMRHHDVVARLGGEEFIILLPEMALSDAMVVAERIRMAVEHCDFTPLGCQHGITLSIGIGAFPTTGVEAQELVEAADAALYEAKASGRNRICLARAVKAATQNASVRHAYSRIEMG